MILRPRYGVRHQEGWEISLMPEITGDCETPLLSIITPSFNQGRFLRRTIRSVLDQDYPNVEYLVIDGASTDGSVDIIRSHESALSYWVSEPDSGQADAINKGMRKTKGKYVAWINSDDTYRPNAFSEAIQALEDEPNAPFVYSNAIGIDANDNQTDWPRYRQYSPLDLLSFNMICQPTVFMRRDVVIRAGGLDDTYHFIFDHKHWIDLSRFGTPVYVNAYWACARRHPEAKNWAMKLRFPEEGYRLIRELRDDNYFGKIIFRHEKRLLSGLDIFEAGYLLRDGQSEEALKKYLSSCFRNPRALGSCWRLMAFTIAKTMHLQKVARGLERARSKVRYSQFVHADRLRRNSRQGTR